MFSPSPSLPPSLQIFYPDLIDKSEAPTYTVTPMKDAPDFAVLQFHAGPPYEVTRPHPVLVGVVKPTSHAFNFLNSRTLRSRLLTGSGSIRGSTASRVSSITIYFSSGSVSKDIATGDKKFFFRITLQQTAHQRARGGGRGTGGAVRKRSRG